MDIKLTYEFFQLLSQDKLNFTYHGNFSDEITDMVLNLVENNIVQGNEFLSVRNKVSFLMVECFQNVIRHGENEQMRNVVERPGLFITRHIGDVYYITSANLVENEYVETLRTKLEQVNLLDKRELKSFYLDVLKNKKGLSPKGGAGLGLIAMARKSGQKIDFDFIKINDKVSYFYMQLKLKSKKSVLTKVKTIPSLKPELAISEAQRLHIKINQEELFLVHKGNFSAEAIHPMLSMIKTGILARQGNVEANAAFHLFIEIIKNVSEHAYTKHGKREAIFLMGEKNGEFIISTGNYIENQKIERLEKRLISINQLKKAEMHKLYENSLLKDASTQNTEKKLGLIDLAHVSSGKLEFNFTEVNAQISFFSLIIKL